MADGLQGIPIQIQNPPPNQPGGIANGVDPFPELPALEKQLIVNPDISPLPKGASLKNITNTPPGNVNYWIPYLIPGAANIPNKDTEIAKLNILPPGGTSTELGINSKYGDITSPDFVSSIPSILIVDNIELPSPPNSIYWHVLYQDIITLEVFTIMCISSNILFPINKLSSKLDDGIIDPLGQRLGGLGRYRICDYIQIDQDTYNNFTALFEVVDGVRYTAFTPVKINLT